MHITETNINDSWKEFVLTNKQGMSVHFLNFGGIITRIFAPDRSGNLENVVLGYKNYCDYEENPNYLGAIIGRVAGRIEQSSFSLHGQTYQLETNDGENHLHGGSTGFHQVLWDVKPFQNYEEVGAELTYFSPDGDGGYPGNVNVTVTYRLTNDNIFIIDYDALSNQPTILTLTNHSYMNLSGNLRDTICNHWIKISADYVAEVDENTIPTGRLFHVADTPFDFRTSQVIKAKLASDHPQIKLVGNGFDHYYFFQKETSPQVTVKEPKSGRIVTVKTTHPGMTFYTANMIDTSMKLREGASRKHLGLCLETQEHAASLNHDSFPNIILKENERYERSTSFSFQTDEF